MARTLNLNSLSTPSLSVSPFVRYVHVSVCVGERVNASVCACMCVCVCVCAQRGGCVRMDVGMCQKRIDAGVCVSDEG